MYVYILVLNFYIYRYMCVCVISFSSLMIGLFGPFMNIIFHTVQFSQYHSSECDITNSPNYFLNLL